MVQTKTVTVEMTFDQDEDGFHSDQYGGTDCDDTNPLINPSVTDDTVDGSGR